MEMSFNPDSYKQAQVVLFIRLKKFYIDQFSLMKSL